MPREAAEVCRRRPSNPARERALAADFAVLFMDAGANGWALSRTFWTGYLHDEARKRFRRRT